MIKVLYSGAMSNLFCRAVATLCFVTTLAFGGVTKEDPDSSRLLKGLKGVRLFAITSNPVISTSILQASLQIRIRQCGISIVGYGEMIDNKSYPTLLITCTKMPSRTGSYVYSTSVQCIQAMHSPTAPRELGRFLAWSKDGLGIAPYESADTDIQQALADDVDAFCKDFLKANPK